ncbi:hypothetical protein J7E62_00345 [Variovorax paradoxus]|nr:hypothetical protein [Variovorax paradoxus]
MLQRWHGQELAQREAAFEHRRACLDAAPASSQQTPETLERREMGT